MVKLYLNCYLQTLMHFKAFVSPSTLYIALNRCGIDGNIRHAHFELTSCVLPPLQGRRDLNDYGFGLIAFQREKLRRSAGNIKIRVGGLFWGQYEPPPVC